MYLESEDGGGQDHPQLLATNLSLSMIRSHCPPLRAAQPPPPGPSPQRAPSLDGARSPEPKVEVKEMVQRSYHMYKGVVLDVETLVVAASIHKLEADSLHSLLVPWMARCGRTHAGCIAVDGALGAG